MRARTFPTETTNIWSPQKCVLPMSLSCHGEASKSGHRIRLLYVSYLGVSDVEKVSGVMKTSPVGLWVCQSDWRRREEEGGMVCTGEGGEVLVIDCLIDIYYKEYHGFFKVQMFLTQGSH